MMKYFLLFIFYFFIANFSKAQLKIVEKNAIPLDGNDSLIHYYMPVSLNLGKAKYDTLKPNEIEKYIETVPADSFQVTRNGQLLLAIGVSTGTEKQYYISDKINGKKTVENSEINGQVSEYRATELIGNGKDNKAGIIFGKFKYNGKDYSLITNSNLENSVLKLVDEIMHAAPTKK
ncbi:hypothetical protein [Rhizosphaericola mali]|uniref:Uncharacterized protein n=1 Tax=Rhizosphaericola mali TaxID=2545455 RepID=A0A5P2GBN6_9BACT|nr:hypothetical protein [Rhizosphaericola mali]QES88981.1 hypothetical protein E0W69_010050 [Rhizosphaericola mali]